LDVNRGSKSCVLQRRNYELTVGGLFFLSEVAVRASAKAMRESRSQQRP